MREILGFSGARPDEAPNAASGLVRRQTRRCGVPAAPERRHAQRAKGLRRRSDAQIWRHCARAAHFAAQQPDCNIYLRNGRRAFGAKIPEKARQGLTAPALRGMMQQKGVAVWYRSGQRPHTGFTGQRQQNVYFVAARVRRGYWADCSP